MKKVVVFCFGFFFALTLSAQNRAAATVSATVQDAAGTRYESATTKLLASIKTLLFAKSMHQGKKFGMLFMKASCPMDALFR